MIESKCEYEVLVESKVLELAKKADHPVRHNSDGLCPNCGHFGQYNLQGKGLTASSIFFSAVLGEWRCQMCELASMGI